MFKYYFQLIQQQIKTVSELKEVEWYMGQFEQSGEQVLFTTPGAYIEFDTLAMDQLACKTQESIISFSVYLVNESVYDDSKRVTDDTINHLGLLDDIYQALTHYKGMLSDLPSFVSIKNTSADRVVVNTLTRTNVQFIHELSNLVISVQTFKGVFRDISAAPEFQKVSATLKLCIDNA